MAAGSGVGARLAELETSEGELPRVLQFFRELADIEEEVGQRATVPEPDLTEEVLRECHAEGRPLLLAVDNLTIDWSLVSEALRQVRNVFGRFSDLFGTRSGNPEALQSGVMGRLLDEGLARGWLEGEDTEPGAAGGSDRELLPDMLMCSLRPYLQAYRVKLMHRVDQTSWRRRYCPICGAAPDLAYLDKERGSRWLVCPSCDAEWLFQRMECPYCGTADQNQLSYFSCDEAPYRLYVCASCRCYIKAIDLRSAGPEVLLPLERLLTFDLDRQALGLGYSRPGQREEALGAGGTRV